MKNDDLRAEAEKMARNILRDHTSITDSLLAFAREHGKQERLRGRIDELNELEIAYDEYSFGSGRCIAERLKRGPALRAELAALKKGEEVTR